MASFRKALRLRASEDLTRMYEHLSSEWIRFPSWENSSPCVAMLGPIVIKAVGIIPPVLKDT